MKALAYWIMEAGKFKNLQDGPAGWRPRAELMLHFKAEGYLLAEFSLAQGEVSLLFYRSLQLTGWGPRVIWRAVSYRLQYEPR